MIFGSTSKNIGLLTISVFAISLGGLFFVDYTLNNILIMLLSFYVLNILGVWMTLHRYYSHKSFELNTAFKWLFSTIAFLTGRGSILGWVYLHRLHHAYTDQEKDPHSPHNLGYKLFGFGHMKKQEGEMKIFLVKELMTPVQLFVAFILMELPLSLKGYKITPDASLLERLVVASSFGTIHRQVASSKPIALSGLGGIKASRSAS